MSDTSPTPVDIALPAAEPSFQIDGEVIEVFPGSGFATLLTNSADALTVSRGTEGIHFEALRVGDRVNCHVAVSGGRVLYAHQQTQSVRAPADGTSQRLRGAQAEPRPVPERPGCMDAKRRPMTKEEFIAEYCRRWGVAWADIAAYRVVVPSGDGAGWTMASLDGQEDAQTMQGPLEPLP